MLRLDRGVILSNVQMKSNVWICCYFFNLFSVEEAHNIIVVLDNYDKKSQLI